MKDKNKIVPVENIKSMIFSFRGLQVMIDRDLAELYGVGTKVLNQAVKRNIERFPNDFRFQLTDYEKHKLVTNCDRFRKLKHSSVNPYAFTEQGVAMLSTVLRSETAIRASIQIMRAFVELKKFISTNAAIFQRLENVEMKQIATDEKIERIFKALENNNLKPKQGIFYNGQIFDAYKFITELIKGAKKSIVLIDNYIDETVLTLFSKNQKVDVKIYTKNVTKQLKLDLEKYNAQYKSIEIKKFNQAHDRFLIIDNKEVYHFGASLKDLGKKWFGFSKFDMEAIELLTKLE
ncbi:ORF6N domain-containing protein [Candidatus Sulfidibacterium hydrothermale]|uniref:ORF6N domain-containing protein n=1 Tax=Candidatus Sulfidibacterium hydrothermale TaxID=2875962 RepID=UPI001F0A795E|nr:ORF6N domain-containing protein [Candidatus Sulfidibacterium hydrothermale]UBM63126.1 ORF6N domain-containing protein [Candidatus Sulfidibacterium hydrothermale]